MRTRGAQKNQNKTIEEEKKETGGRGREREAAMDEVSSRFRAPCRSPSLATAAAALCFLASLRCCFKTRGGESALLLPLSLSSSPPFTALLPVPSLKWDALSFAFSFLPGGLNSKYRDAKLSGPGVMSTRLSPLSFPPPFLSFSPCWGLAATPVGEGGA